MPAAIFTVTQVRAIATVIPPLVNIVLDTTRTAEMLALRLRSLFSAYELIAMGVKGRSGRAHTSGLSQERLLTNWDGGPKKAIASHQPPLPGRPLIGVDFSS